MAKEKASPKDYDEEDLKDLEFEDDEAEELEEDAKEETKKGWDESKHPRHPKGSEAGGEFRSGDKVTVHTGRRTGAVGTVMGNAAPDSDYVRVKVGPSSKLYHPSDLTPANTGPFSGHQFDVKQDALGLKPGQYRVTDYTANETSFGNFSRVTVRNLNSGLMTTIPVGNAQMMGLLPMGDGMPEKPKTKKFFKAETVSDELGMVFGWAIVCKEDGADYFDSQDDHITEKAMLGAAVDFMENSRVMKEMHAGEEQGSVVFAWPLTEDIAKAMGIETQKTGLMIAVKPGNPEILEKFKTGEYSGFSIGGTRLTDEVVKEE